MRTMREAEAVIRSAKAKAGVGAEVAGDFSGLIGSEWTPLVTTLGSLEDLPRVEELRSGAKSADSSAQAPAPAPASPSEPAPATTPTPTEPAPEPAPTTTESPESS